MLRVIVMALVLRRALFGSFATDSKGATAIEYGLIVGGIAIAILATVFAIGDELDDMFTMFQTRIGNAVKEGFR